MSRENPDTDEMMRLTRAREKIRRALTKAAAAATTLQKQFEVADAALKAFEVALQQQMMVGAGLVTSPGIERGKLVERLQEVVGAVNEARLIREARVAAGTFDETAAAEFGVVIQAEAAARRAVVEHDQQALANPQNQS